jgi:cell division protein FtsX
MIHDNNSHTIDDEISRDEIKLMIENSHNELFNESFKKLNNKLWGFVLSMFAITIGASFYLGSRLSTLTERIAVHQVELEKKVDYQVYLQFVDWQNEREKKRDEKDADFMEKIEEMNKAIKAVQPHYRGIKMSDINK